MATKKSTDTAVEILIPEIQKQTIRLAVIGTTALVMNTMSEKARQTLFVPPAGRMTDAEKKANTKHDPFAEYRGSPYYLDHDEAPTYLAQMSSAFKGAMCTAALDLPGPRKTQIGRLVHVQGDYTAIYGKPYLFCSVVRLQDINHTPDIRTRAILPRWAAIVEISFVEPLLTKQAMLNLLTAAGVTVGIGDWRTEKGKGNYGSFRPVQLDDPEFLDICKESRQVQIQAIKEPEFYDSDTRKLVTWWSEQMRLRGRAPAVTETAAANGYAADVPEEVEVRG